MKVTWIRRKKMGLLLGLLLTAGLLSGCGKQEAVTTPETTVVTTEVTEQGTEADAKKARAAYVCTINSNNSWESNGMICAQFDGVIRNETQDAGKDWRVSVTVPEGSKLENGWNGEYSLNGNTLTITPVEYNTELAAGGEITFGFILDTKETFQITEGSLLVGENSYTVNDASESNQVQEDTQEAAQSTEATSENEKKKMAAEDMEGTPVANHGALSVDGTDIVDKNGEIYQLKGVSTHGLSWFPDYVNQEAFASLSTYGVNAIRLAMYSAENNGYCTGGNKEQLEQLIDDGVTACKNLGLYVIIDWHVLGDQDPNVYKEEAKTFFEKMSKKYAGCENVIYEICNEPNGGTSWEAVKTYAEEVIPVIRANDNNAIIIVGTPTWSQDVDIAADNPITGQNNIIYAAHFYASTHKEEIRSKVTKAREAGLPVIISECSICEASGNGSINYEEAEKWMDFINTNHLSYFAWNLSNKEEQSSLLKPSVSKTSDFQPEDFSETGTWFMEQFGK